MKSSSLGIGHMSECRYEPEIPMRFRSVLITKHVLPRKRTSVLRRSVGEASETMSALLSMEESTGVFTAPHETPFPFQIGGRYLEAESK